ncbi:hypothetical protein MASR2M78_30110 [Treponema sp.]
MMKTFFKWATGKSVYVFVIAILITAFAGFLVVSNLRMETNLDEYMPKDHPAFIFSDEAEERFMIRDAILIAMEHPESVYNAGSLQKIIDIEDALIAFPEIEEADIRSLHTVDNIVGSEYGLDVHAFYTTPPSDTDEIKEIQAAVKTNNMVYGRIISKDEKTTLIIVDLPNNSFSEDLYHRVTALASSFEGPETLHVAGRPIVEGTMAILGPRDMARMGPLVVLVISIVLLIVLRSFSRTLITLAVVLFSTIWSFALMVGLGYPVYTVTIMIPVMLIAIGVAYGIHLYNHIDYYVGKHPDASRTEVAKNVIDVIWKPVLFAALTTMAGFVSLVTSQVFPVKYFGIFSAVGVLWALLLTMLLVPAGIMIFGIGKGRKTATKVSGPSFGGRFADTIVAKPVPVLLGTALVVGLALFGISRVWINTSFLDNFEKSSDIVKTDAFMNRNFGGTSTLNVIFDAEDHDAFKQPELLRLLEEVQEGALVVDKVGDTISIADYLKRMNLVMHEERPEFDRIPDDIELIAQYLLLYEMSGNPDNLWKVVDPDYHGANLTVQLKSDNSRTIGNVVAYFDTYAPKFQDYGVTLKYAGSGYKSMVFADLILQGQISSLGISLAVVFLLVAFMFRSALLGLVAAIPVSIAMAVNFGVMGLLNLPLTTSTALISSIAVGIGVDYSIHFIERYRESLKETADPTASARFAMSLTGRAVFLNALIVIAGFMVLLFSVFPPNRQVGALVSLNMVTAFISTVTIMFLVLRKSYVSIKENHK